MNQNLKNLFQIEDRVIISSAGGWQNDSSGKVISGAGRIQIREGEEFYYWVEFDTPQHDLSEDGPYSVAQILSKYLNKVV